MTDIKLAQQPDRTYKGAITDPNFSMTISNATVEVTPYVAPAPVPAPAPAPAPPHPPAPPAPPAPPKTPGVPMPSVIKTPIPISPVGNGAHTTVVTVTDGAARVWTAVGHVGSDATAPGLLACLVDKNGAPHPRLQAMFYADCCHVMATRMDNAYDETGCSLTVTYDGAPVTVPHSSYADGTYTFWRGCRGPAIRYGVQVGWDASKIDWSLLPCYSKDHQTPLPNLSKCDFSWNGLGDTLVSEMGTTGERGEIGFIKTTYMAFLRNPCDATWAAVRLGEDHCGNWGILYVSEPATGGIIHYTDYPEASTMPPAQWAAYQAQNPIAGYKGSYRGDVLTPPTTGWANGGCPFGPNTAHLTSYGMLACMMGAARDRDLCSFWANYSTIDQGPGYTRSGGFVEGPQRRFAWALRSMFIACYYGAEADLAYFNKEVDRNAAIADAQPKNAFGIIDQAFAYPASNGDEGLSEWMINYVAMVFGAVALKRPNWLSYAQYTGLLPITWASKVYYTLMGSYNLVCLGSDKKLLTNFDDIALQTAIHQGYDLTTAQAIVAAKTVEEVYNIIKTWTAAYNVGKTGLDVKIMWEQYENGVMDIMGYEGSDSAYPAGDFAAIYSYANIGTPGIDAAVQIALKQPQKINYLADEKYHIVLANPAAYAS